MNDKEIEALESIFTGIVLVPHLVMRIDKIMVSLENVTFDKGKITSYSILKYEDFEKRSRG